MVLNGIDILQIDATVIAGILILLTITSFVEQRDTQSSKPVLKPRKAVGYVGIPFALSAIIALLASMPLTPSAKIAAQDQDSLLIIAIGLTLIGFGYMIGVFIQINRIKEGEEIVFDVGRTYFMQPAENDNFTGIWISVRIDNKGQRSTTVHSATLSFKYDGKIHELKTGDSMMLNNIDPSSTNTQHFMFTIPKNQLRIKDRITNCKITIIHTYDKKTISIGEILETR